MKCKYCEIELSDIDIRFGNSPEGLYMKDIVRIVTIEKTGLKKIQ